MSPAKSPPKEITADQFKQALREAVTNPDPKYQPYRDFADQFREDNPKGKPTAWDIAHYAVNHWDGFTNIYRVTDLDVMTPAQAAKKTGPPPGPSKPPLATALTQRTPGVTRATGPSGGATDVP